MHSTLIVGRMDPESSLEVAQLFTAFDETGMPHRMGTRRRELFSYNGLYFHLQDFLHDDGRERVSGARTDPLFIKISEDLRRHIRAYDPETWRSPVDAMATRFYHWQPPSS